MFKVNIRTVFWLAIFSLPLAFYLGAPYAPNLENPPWFLTLTYIGAYSGQIFLLMCAGLLILVYPVLLCFKRITKLSFLYGLSILCLLHLLLYLDAQAFLNYRYHISYTLVDLFINDQQGIRSLSVDSWISFALHVAIILVYNFIAVFIALMLSWRNVHSKLFVILILILFGIANFINAYANVIQINAVVDLKNRIPLYQPLTMNSLLLKTGMVKPIDYEQSSLIKTEGFLNYPKQKISYFENTREPFNVILISVNSLRADAVNEKQMPALTKWAQSSLVFNNHYAASNLHTPSIFGLMYGIPGSYLQSALAEQTRPVLFDALEQHNYQNGIFLSESFISHQLKDTVFLGQDKIMHYGDFNESVQARDLSTINKLKDFINNAKTDQLFFTYVSLNGVAEYFPIDQQVKLDLKVALGIDQEQGTTSDQQAEQINIDPLATLEIAPESNQAPQAKPNLEQEEALVSSNAQNVNVVSKGNPSLSAELSQSGQPSIHPLDQQDLMIDQFELLQESKNKMDVEQAKAYYASAVKDMDQLLSDLLNFIESKELLYNTIVIITSDHGEEFNDNAQPFIGTGSNFTDPQVKVPLIVRWPNKKPQTFNNLNSAYNVSTSLLTAVFGVKNKIEDFSIGYDLFNRYNSKYVLATNFKESAIIEEDRIVLIDNLGLMSFKQKDYQDSSNTTRDGYLFDAIKELTFYFLPPDEVKAQSSKATNQSAQAPTQTTTEQSELKQTTQQVEQTK